MTGRLPLLATLWVAGVAPAPACDYSVAPPAERIKTAAMVFAGRVLPSDQPARPRIGGPVSFFVEEAFQGTAKGATVMASSGPGGCEGVFQAGERYLVFLSPTGGGRLPDASPMSGTMPIWRAAAVIKWLRNRSRPKWKTQLLGMVWNADGTLPGFPLKPLAGAKIVVSGNGKTASATSDRDGIYEVDDLPPGEYEITSSISGHDVTPRQLRVGACCEFVDIAAVGDGHIEGSVRNADGAPLDGIRVELVQLWPHNEVLPFKDVETAGGGNYRFHGVPPGQYRVGVNILSSPTVRQPWATTFTPISVSAMQQIRGVEVTLPPPLGGRKVSVRVVMPDGREAPEASVSVGDIPGYIAPQEYRADARGECRFTWIEGVRFGIVSGAEDAAGKWLTSDAQYIQAGEEPVQATIQLHYPPGNF